MKHHAPTIPGDDASYDTLDMDAANEFVEGARTGVMALQACVTGREVGWAEVTGRGSGRGGGDCYIVGLKSGRCDERGFDADQMAG